MALMFPRLARNFAKMGTTRPTNPRSKEPLNALMPSDGPMCILDPCAGEGVAIAEASHAPGANRPRRSPSNSTPSGRAMPAAWSITARTRPDGHDDLQAVLRTTVAESTVWRPVQDVNGNIGYQGQGRARLEKLFYQRSLSLLQYSGVLVFIVPGYVLDAELVGWLTRHYTDLRIYRAVETQFKQVVIFGRRARQRELAPDGVKAVRTCCCRLGLAKSKPRNCRANGRSCRTSSRQSGRAGAFLPRDDGARTVRRRGWPAARPLAVAGHALGPRSSRCVHRRGPCPTGISPWLWPRARSPASCAPRRARARRQR